MNIAWTLRLGTAGVSAAAQCVLAGMMIGLCGFFCKAALAESLVLADGGATSYAIYHDASAPGSVRLAAKELQRVIRAATRAEMPINTAPSSNMICLGDNAETKKAGFSAASLPEEGFRIVTQAPHLYIFGKDTPDGEKTAGAGFSRGTEFGVYTFLEKVVGVRWLMPGEWGEEIPNHAKLVAPGMSVSDQPAFVFRVLGIGDPPVVKEWLVRQKVSGDPGYRNTAASRIIHTPHYWEAYIPSETLAKHPDWRAVGGEKNKFCTRNPEAVQEVVRGVLQWFDAHPQWPMASISPSDGQGFCRCEKCAPFIEKDPHGEDSFTLNLLEFYNEVARRVASERPGKMVSGYAYGKCEYPPKTAVQVEPNLFIEWTPLNYYGLGLYKSAYRNEFERVAAAWRAMTKEVGYQNYCHWHRSENGAPYGPALSILKFQFPALKRYGYQGIQDYGCSAWGYGAPTNYLLAKLMWNPSADVDALYREWLQLAYGDGWSAMNKLYRLLDEAFRSFKTSVEPFHYNGDNYEIKMDKIQHIYLPNLARIERLCREAMERAKTGREQRRLQMFADNLVVFHYHLRKAGLLAKPEQSFFYRSDEQYEQFIGQKHPNVYGTKPGWLWVEPEIKPIAPPFAEAKRALLIPRVPAGRVAPVIDGDIQAAEWRQAAVADGFLRLGTNAAAVQSSVARLLYNERALYIAIECPVAHAGAISNQAIKRDHADIYAGEVVEVFFNYTADPAHYWHLAISSGNAQWDGMGSSPTRNLDWKSATRQGEKKWTVEIAIPFEHLEIDPPAGRTWAANVARSTSEKPDREYSSWNGVEKTFLEPEHFGTWTFSKD